MNFWTNKLLEVSHRITVNTSFRVDTEETEVIGPLKIKYQPFFVDNLKLFPSMQPQLWLDIYIRSAE